MSEHTCWACGTTTAPAWVNVPFLAGRYVDRETGEDVGMPAFGQITLCTWCQVARTPETDCEWFAAIRERRV